MENEFNIQNYKRLFTFHGKVPFIISYDFVESYAHLGGMAFCGEDIWSSYMLKKYVSKTEKIGLEIYKSKEKYLELRESIYNLFSSSIEKSDEIISENISKENVVDYFKITQEYRVAYQKLEFFYTDLAFLEQENYPQIKENFETFEKLKLDGREILNKIFFVKNAQFTRVISKIAFKFNIDEEDLLFYSSKEIINLFEGKKVESEILRKRKNAYILIAEANNDIVEYTDINALEIINKIETKKDNSDSEKELKGQIAHKGKVTAPARVIKVSLDTYDEISKFVNEMVEGEILVVESTEPSIIIACKKASAIITNQGGMMSHAAIVAREMKIPCIVGTYTATEFINTGDLVEVDANTGIVRKIS